MELHPLKMLLHSQGENQQSEKAPYKMGGNICKKNIYIYIYEKKLIFKYIRYFYNSIGGKNKPIESELKA